MVSRWIGWDAYQAWANVFIYDCDLGGAHAQEGCQGKENGELHVGMDMERY